MTPGQLARGHLVERAMGMLGDETPPPMPSATPEPGLGHLLQPPRRPIALALLQAAGLVTAPGHTRNRVLEELALVRHQVLRGVDTNRDDVARAHIVLIASALPHEGKSFIALNLAAGMAAQGARQVVLVDADGRVGSVTDALGASGSAGLRDLVADPTRAAAGLLMPTAIERLSFLSHGSAGGGQRETPSGSTMATAIQRLALARPDHVLVLDPPPCLSTSDCSALAAVAGQVVLVVDAERTLRNEVEAALDVLDACPVLQLLLNRVRLTVNDTFGARGDYGAANG
jgi:receptor protein-tyrosine kinase